MVNYCHKILLCMVFGCGATTNHSCVLCPSGALKGNRINTDTVISTGLRDQPLPRAMGNLQVASAVGASGSCLKELTQAGSLKMLFPRVANQMDLMGVSINTAGGIAGGDRFSIAGRAGASSRLTITTQAAERIYRAKGSEIGRLSTELTVEAGARLDWLPQETILYDGAALCRKLRINMAADASFLAVEPLVFGRITMGERLNQLSFKDNIHLMRGDDLVFADAIRLVGDAAGDLASPFSTNKAGAMASVVYVAPDADLFLPRIRDLLRPTGGASLIRKGVLFTRLMATDSYILRQSLIPILTLLRGSDLPKTWTL